MAIRRSQIEAVNAASFQWFVWILRLATNKICTERNLESQLNATIQMQTLQTDVVEHKKQKKVANVCGIDCEKKLSDFGHRLL